MSLTPQDIQSKQFHTSFRGFDVDEVDAFLEKVAEEFLVLNLENKQAKEKIAALDEEIEHYKQQEKTFQKAILSAQKISDEMQSKTREEAQATLSQARQEAEQMIKQAREESEELLKAAKNEAEKARQEGKEQIEALKEEIAALANIKEKAEAELRATLNRYLAAIDSPRAAAPAAPAPGPAAEEGEEIPDEPLPAAPILEEEEPVAPAAVNPEATAAEDSREGDDDDLSDLYRKIDLLEQGDEASQPVPLDLDDIKPLDSEEEDEDNDLSIPDLDDKLIFTLEDPLDDLEPSIAINSDKASDK